MGKYLNYDIKEEVLPNDERFLELTAFINISENISFFLTKVLESHV